MQTLEQLRNGSLKGTVRLKLSEALSSFPIEIFDLADTLEVLDLSGNELSELPADMGRLSKLRVLFCSNNPFTVLPDVLGDLQLLDIVGFKANKITTVPARSLNPNIRWLILTDNQITELPKEIGQCSRMQKLMLAGNRISDLPVELSNCSNLSLLRISANQLTQVPGWLLSMPRLAWLAFSGNRFSTGVHTASLPFINWSQLNIEHVLGEGASGIISKGVWTQGHNKKDVAIKLFKGAVTSDGLPDDEMNAFMAAGGHEGLVGLVGQIAEHPDGKKGLVMELIPERFYNLGLPPTFESCTRDVFKEGTHISVAQLLSIMRTIASVAAHLHSNGIMHGDLYAHNTLVDADGTALLSDFGAASFYDISNKQMASALERLEVSAWGYLLDDLLSVCNDASGNATLTKLKTLRDAAIAANVASRPTFEDIKNELATR